MSDLELRAKVAEIYGFTNVRICPILIDVFGDSSYTLSVKVPEYENNLPAIITVFEDLKHNWSLSSYYDGESSMFCYSAFSLVSEDEYDIEYKTQKSLAFAMCNLLLLINEGAV